MKQIHGIPAAPGIAIGPVFHYRPVKLAIEKYAIINVVGVGIWIAICFLIMKEFKKSKANQRETLAGV